MNKNRYLCRGKSRENGKWVTGVYSPYSWDAFGKREEKPQIIIISENKYLDGLWCEVVPETIGQYTGFTDKNGKKIFEGDILKAHYDEENPQEYAIVIVLWNNGWHIQQDNMTPDLLEEADCHVSEVIGNIHDNSELLKG